MVIFDTTIAYNRMLSPNYYLLGLEGGEKLEPFIPGQFIMIRIEASLDPFLRRPFSIYRIKDGIIDILYKVIGKGTLLLKDKKPGSVLNILGPLGNGFTIEKLGAPHVLIGGGVGAASLYALCDEIKKKGGRALVLLGGKGIADIPWAKDFMNLGAEVFISSEDGSYQFCGTVLDLLYSLLDMRIGRDSYFYVCGPWEMIRSFCSFAREKSLQSQVSLERNLACGLGICLGCAIKVKENGNVVIKRVCRDGPVFRGSEIIYDA